MDYGDFHNGEVSKGRWPVVGETFQPKHSSSSQFTGIRGQGGKGMQVDGQTWELSLLSRNRNCNSACFVSRLKEKKKSSGQFCPNVLIGCLRHISINDKPC